MSDANDTSQRRPIPTRGMSLQPRIDSLKQKGYALYRPRNELFIGVWRLASRSERKHRNDKQELPDTYTTKDLGGISTLDYPTLGISSAKVLIRKIDEPGSISHSVPFALVVRVGTAAITRTRFSSAIPPSRPITSDKLWCEWLSATSSADAHNSTLQNEKKNCLTLMIPIKCKNLSKS